MLYSGLISASAASSGAYMPAFYYFAIPATVPFAVRLLADGRGIFILMGLLTFFYLGICFVFVRTYHKNTLLLIRAQFENQALLEQVREEKKSAETSQGIAEQAIVEKNRFLAAASHDLRQPLHALGLFIGALRREVPKKQLHLIDSIQGSVGALNHLFNSLLDVSRLDAGVVQAHQNILTWML
jgi:signal transduction histidine kinase